MRRAAYISTRFTNTDGGLPAVRRVRQLGGDAI